MALCLVINMSDKFIITKDSVDELRRMSCLLYKSFKQISLDMASSPDRFTSDIELDYSLNPENYYKVQYGLKYTAIHKRKNNHYTIECRGFKPEDIEPLAYSEKSLKLYADLYGDFTDFGDCLNHFADCVSYISRVSLRSLF